MQNGTGELPSYDLSSLVILIAEKHSTMRTIIREVLHKFGIQKIYEVATPEDAFDTFRNVDPDVVFIDWGPKFDGIALLNKIRRDKSSPNQEVPVIMVTPHTEQSQVYKARDAGMSEFLAQPVSAKTIYEHLVRIIEQPREFIKSETYVGPDRRWHRDRFVEGGRRQTDRKNVEEALGLESEQEPAADTAPEPAEDDSAS